MAGAANPLKALSEKGQSIWIDYFHRDLILTGELERMRDEDLVSGITSNPTIFEKAIVGSDLYDESLSGCLLQNPRMRASALFEKVAVEDLQQAADALRPVFDRSGGLDGFVSMEVSPAMAHNAEGTMAEARRLWHALSRPNVMIKVPATGEGLLAIEELTAEGINVNVTLMFSLSRYIEVANAYIRGVERCADPRRVTSVASFFVSRVDTKVDRALEAIGGEEALALRGKAAIANSRMVYRTFLEIFGEPFAPLKERGARVQKPLWASTSTKNPAYRDCLYVEELIGADTVNTLPPATLKAFRDHGVVRDAAVMEGDPQSTLDRLAEQGVDLARITDELLQEGVDDFANSYTKLIEALDEKRKLLLSRRLNTQELQLGAATASVEKRLQQWAREEAVCRMWRKDRSFWSADPDAREIEDRLGWLSLPNAMREQAEDIKTFAEDVRKEGLRDLVLLGMGGSSMAPEVFQATFGNAKGFPELRVLDSTHPGAVREVAAQIDPRRTLFIVSSKSGTTLETLSLYSYFWDQAAAYEDEPGAHFIAITDPDTPLAREAKAKRFRRVFTAPTDVGGRYSALTVFGLVPAALIGVDIDHLLLKALEMSECCHSFADPARNPGAILGATLGELGLAGRNKATFVTGPEFSSVPAWLEQLIAESTGKNDKGLIPIAGEPVGPPEVYGRDRLFIGFSLDRPGSGLNASLDALRDAGFPVVRIALSEMAALGQEFFRWEFATAAAGGVLGINPFDQPDVQLAKDLAKEAMKSAGKRTDGGGEFALESKSELTGALRQWLGDIRQGDYISIQAYLAPTRATNGAIETMRARLRDRLRAATTVGYGPRFLHSTGQLHKGGADNGLFMQLVDTIAEDVAVPGKGYSFGELIRAQAEGDYQALRKRGRRVVRINIGKNPAAGVVELDSLLAELLDAKR